MFPGVNSVSFIAFLFFSFFYSSYLPPHTRTHKHKERVKGNEGLKVTDMPYTENELHIFFRISSSTLQNNTKS